MGICQSIIYQWLYEDLFGVYDAMEAAKTMLYGLSDNCAKPEELVNADYQGSAMEALENMYLIPFPYKVAKCMDPTTYRNIEFDVFSCERLKEKSRMQELEDEQQLAKSFERLTVAKLDRGTPCMLRYEQCGSYYGFVQGPCGPKMEIYIPLLDSCVFVERNAVLPLKDPPPEMGNFLPRDPRERPRLRALGLFQVIINLNDFKIMNISVIFLFLTNLLIHLCIFLG